MLIVELLFLSNKPYSRCVVSKERSMHPTMVSHPYKRHVLYRYQPEVAVNEKISAAVGYMQMSAPAISLYALTIMAQPSFEQEIPDINR